jgi:hypothetical protein
MIENSQCCGGVHDTTLDRSILDREGSGCVSMLPPAEREMEKKEEQKIVTADELLALNDKNFAKNLYVVAWQNSIEKQSEFTEAEMERLILQIKRDLIKAARDRREFIRVNLSTFVRDDGKKDIPVPHCRNINLEVELKKLGLTYYYRTNSWFRYYFDLQCEMCEEFMEREKGFLWQITLGGFYFFLAPRPKCLNTHFGYEIKLRNDV